MYEVLPNFWETFQTQATITVQRLPPGAVPAAPAFYGDGNYEYKEGRFFVFVTILLV